MGGLVGGGPGLAHHEALRGFHRKVHRNAPVHRRSSPCGSSRRCTALKHMSARYLDSLPAGVIERSDSVRAASVSSWEHDRHKVGSGDQSKSRSIHGVVRIQGGRLGSRQVAPGCRAIGRLGGGGWRTGGEGRGQCGGGQGEVRRDADRGWRQLGLTDFSCLGLGGSAVRALYDLTAGFPDRRNRASSPGRVRGPPRRAGR